MAHSNSTTSLSAGVKALADGNKAFAHTQALWRFLNNEAVTPERLSAPLVAGCHAVLAQCEGDYALCVHDWSRLHYGGHAGKKDRLQMTHATDIGYELQSSLLVNAQNGLPLSVAAQNLVSAEGIWQSRNATIQVDGQTHLDELGERIAWIEQQQFARRLVHMVDREGDSAGHLRQWSRRGHYWPRQGGFDGVRGACRDVARGCGGAPVVSTNPRGHLQRTALHPMDRRRQGGPGAQGQTQTHGGQWAGASR